MRAIVAMFLCGCASSRIMANGIAVTQCELPVIVTASANLTPAEQSIVRAAADDWPGAFIWGGSVPWSPDSTDAPGNPVVIVGRPERDYNSRGSLASAKLKIRGDGCIVSANVCVYAELIGDEGRKIIGHELGHVLGIAHQSSGVMKESIH